MHRPRLALPRRIARHPRSQADQRRRRHAQAVVHQCPALQNRADEGGCPHRPPHFDGIVAWTQTRQTNGFIEALNGLFQAAKRKARGYTRFATMRTALFLIPGKLDFTSINSRRLPTPNSVEPN
jgi:hypothetical protein